MLDGTPVLDIGLASKTNMIAQLLMANDDR